MVAFRNFANASKKIKRHPVVLITLLGLNTYTLRNNTTVNNSKHNTVARSRNHCCRGKAISITYFSVCVCARACERGFNYPACNAHAPNCQRWSLSLHHTFRHYFIHGTIFVKKLLNIKYVFWFSLQHLFETSLTRRIIQRDTVINVKTCSCSVPVIITGF